LHRSILWDRNSRWLRYSLFRRSGLSHPPLRFLWDRWLLWDRNSLWIRFPLWDLTVLSHLMLLWDRMLRMNLWNRWSLWDLILRLTQWNLMNL
jgi:hypothetical protein